MSSSDGSHELNFVVHWLNNKELHFTQEAERIIMDLTKQRNTPTPEDGTTSDDMEDDGSGSQPDASVVSESSDPADPAKSIFTIIKYHYVYSVTFSPQNCYLMSQLL